MKGAVIFGVMGICLISCQYGLAQDGSREVSGLYASFGDFEYHNLSYPIDCSNKKDKLRLNAFFGSSSGYIVSGGKIHRFNKNKVYRYHICENKNFRFYNHSTYLILDTTGFYIYYQFGSMEQIKGKALVRPDIYFFSKMGNGEMMVLSIDNLKKAFPDNYRLHYALDANFRSDRDLITYDSFQNMYKVKYLYAQSVK